MDMLRLLGHGQTIKIVETNHKTCNVDVPEDLEKASFLMERDPFFNRYRDD